MKFTHLHVHTHYSLLDGLSKIDELLEYTKKLGMDSVAITDHGVLYGAIEFYKKAKKAGIKPIIGAEMYLAYEGMQQKRPNIDNKRYHLVLLVKNETGYKNLVKLITKAHLEGFYYRPRVDEELLAKHSEGLIALTACIQGKVPSLILADQYKEAKETALKYQKIFGKDNFYLELQHHPNISKQKIANEGLVRLSKELDIPLVATNDSHYLKPEDAEAQDILMLINTGADIDDPERISMKADDFSIRSPEQMAEDFKDYPEAIKNTQKIADRCNFEFVLGKTKIPGFKTPENQTSQEYLKELCLKGSKKLYGEPLSEEVKDRLNYELDIINKMGFSSYFLIVQDFVKWAKDQRIVVGPGRGSVGGSIVAYTTGITTIDPLKWGLLFERFLNPARISMPDIDLDFTDRRRNELLDYVAQKYGRNNVAQICTFGTMAARGSIRDVGRSLGYEYSYCDRIAKMIPTGSTLDEALDEVSELKELYKNSNKGEVLINLAKKLEGVIRHISTHACGVVISKNPLDNSVPLQHPSQNEKDIITQYEMHAIEDLGLLKMDFLGLKNLTIIEDTLSRIYAVQNEKIDISLIPLDDKKTYKLLQKGKTIGVFQLESAGFRKYLKQLKPTNLEDLIVMIALYRPGPMSFIPEYIGRKKGKRKVEYLHPKLEKILKKTYGLPVYQEDLMKIAQELAGFSLSEADILRKAIGKKIRSLLVEQKKKLIQGMKDNQISEKVAQKIWEWILPFASYGFNRCLTGDTEIINAKTGSKTTIQEIYDNKKLPSIHSLNDELKLEESPTVKVFQNGKKEVYKIKTRLGKEIKSTSNHPFLTIKGWEKLENIKKGDRIGLAREISINNKGIANIKDYQLAVLGYMIAENSPYYSREFYFYSDNNKTIQDYKKSLEKFKNTKVAFNKQENSFYIERVNLKKASEAIEWMRKIGIYNKKPTEKSFPEFVFRLNKRQITILLAKTFQKNGSINLKRKCPQIFYTTPSLSLAKQIQHLLLRLGVVASLHQKKNKYKNKGKIKVKKDYILTINQYRNIKNFSRVIRSHLIGKKKQDLDGAIKQYLTTNGKIKKWSVKGSKDIIPIEIREKIREKIVQAGYNFTEFAEKHGFSKKLLWIDKNKKGYSRETLEIIGRALPQNSSKPVLDLAHSDVYWDEILEITPIGKQETYDLTIKDTHNFLANDFIVHNSHSCAYAFIAYQTAYLKANYPIEFMAALLTSVGSDNERVGDLIKECEKMNLEVLPPDINESWRNFTVVPKTNQIRFGLLAVKNVGAKIVESIIQERKENGTFQSINDFASRISPRNLNKRALESLIKAGAFDNFAERNTLLSNIPTIVERSREKEKRKNSGQKALFAGMKFDEKINLEPTEPATKEEKLLWEKNLLGLFISSHPLDDFKNIIEKRAVKISNLNSVPDRHVTVGGIILKINRIITKKSKRPMCFLTLEDFSGRVEVVVFPSVFEENSHLIKENNIVLISGTIDKKEDSPKILCNEIEEIKEI